MRVSHFGPCFVVDHVALTAQFYVDHFGFTVDHSTGWFASLSNGEPEHHLSFIRRGMRLLPPPYGDRTVTGAIIGFHVDDAEAEACRLRDAGVRVLTGLVDEPYGQRHFLCTDPNDILIDVIEATAADDDWLDRYAMPHRVAKASSGRT